MIQGDSEIYLLDANVLIRAHEDYYPLDRLPQFWDWVIEAALAGHIKMPFEIYEEIAIYKGALSDWICDSNTKKALILNEDVSGDHLQRVLDEGYGGDLTDSDLIKMGKDPFLVAYGMTSSDRIIVTKETSKPSAQKGNCKVPDVCNRMNVIYVRDFELYRLLNFNTKG